MSEMKISVRNCSAPKSSRCRGGVKVDWVVGMKFPVTSLGFQETGSVNMVFAKTPNGNALRRG